MSDPTGDLPADASNAQLFAYARDLQRLLREREDAQAQLLAYVADLKTLLRERQATRHAADSAEDAKARFLACMSHEMRTPLTAIIGFSELLLHEETRPQNVDSLQRVVSAARQLAALVDRLLVSASLQRSDLVVAARPCRPAELLQTLAAEYGPRAQARGLTLECELAASASVELMLDAAKLAMALRALLDNALKYSPSGEIRLRLAEAGDPPCPTWIEVEDPGCGPPAGYADQLFALFTQPDSSPARPYDGAGLGLSMAHALAQLIGGELLHLPPNAEAGNRFRIVLPAR